MIASLALAIVGVAATAWFVCYFALKQPKNWHIVGKSEEKKSKEKIWKQFWNFCQNEISEEKKRIEKKNFPPKILKTKNFPDKVNGPEGPKDGLKGPSRLVGPKGSS